MVRIPDRFTKEEKTDRINIIVKFLGLQKCLQTVIGRTYSHGLSGLSGGEKKRASIACELLTDPDILLLDEPTSGLDSSTAHTLMVQLKNYATGYNKTIVATIHQPSSQVFHMFSTLLLLVEGEMAYFGHASSAMGYFTDLGMPCIPDYNPADFLPVLEKCFDVSYFLFSTMSFNIVVMFLMMLLYFLILRVKHFIYTGSKISVGSETVFVAEKTLKNTYPRWPTSMLHQLKMLNWRTIKQSKGQIFQKYDFIHALFLALVMGAVYFQIANVENTVRDKMGLVFFSMLHWGLRIRFATIWSLRQETDVIRKERSVGSYRLSAYYLSKITSELPLLLVIPTLFNTAVYWAAGLGGVGGYFAFCGLGILNCLLIQGVAHIIGVCITDLTLSMLIMDCFNIGGLLCNETSVTSYPRCLVNNTNMVTSQDILVGVGIDLPLHCYVSTMAISIIGLRVLGYYVLKWKGT
ncbi:ABC transporter G family member 9 [Mizuhopecten yessoensis]|uniref:ABC transporter G family member 9 n=1 Tax=Mizuhopecten yessoensis TaxID=6573 RepID=A0A210PX01_MIZYE|nr:ABC transporter G family member 9 [Mizuhopecten yessoensis]